MRSGSVRRFLTLLEKFKIIPIAQLKTNKIKDNGKEIETSKNGKLLGLNITTHAE